MRVRIKPIWAPIIAGLLLLLLLLPQLALADGPELLNVSVTDITDTTAKITWTVTTNNTIIENRVNYGTTTALGSYKPDTNNITNPSIILTGLIPGTKYYFEVESTDTSGTTPDDNDGAFYSFITLAPATYSITLEPACGVCGELWKPKYCTEVIEVTAVVAMAGDYRICWDSRAAANVVEGGTFTTTGAGTYILTFHMPEATRGIHKVYLTNSFYDDLGTDAVAEFVVNPFVKIYPDDPAEGPVGTGVTLNGYGFSASQAIGVTLFQGEVKKGEEKTTTADPTTGSWTITYTIPATPGGGYTFNVGPPTSTEVWLSKYFKVIPSITPNTSSGKVGQTIEISGKGFASKEEGIEVTFDGKVVKKNIPPADENGSWSTVIVVPPCQCGSYIIDASGTLTSAHNVPDVNFRVIAGISVTPISAYVGDTITVVGGGFAPRETGIQVYFDDEPVAIPTTITADINGCWESSFTLPSSAYGSHTVSASGDITQPAVTDTLNTNAQITGLSTNNGAPGDSVHLTGNGFGGGKKLTVTIGGIAAPGEDGKPLNTLAPFNGNVDITFLVPKGSTEGQRTLVVYDEGGATASVGFTVTKKTLSTTPLPISPKDSTLRSGEVTFQWQGVTGVTGYTYTLEISISAGSASIWSKSGIEGSSYTLTDTETVIETLPNGTYYWRVKIVDDYDNASDWSDSSKFTVAQIPTWVWVVVGLTVLVVLMTVAYRETKFKVTE